MMLSRLLRFLFDARMRALPTLLICLAIPAATAHAQKVDNDLRGKVLVGYQGWFRCPGDGSPRNEWSHWSKGSPAPETMSVDLFPDTSELASSSRCLLPGVNINGKPAYVFSSFPKDTAEKHFEWMKQYHIDGALLQRFVGSIQPQRQEGDVVLRNDRSAAEANGRLFAVEYDLSGGRPETVLSILQQDWTYMTQQLKVTDSRDYLRYRGKPVVAIWGLGFNDHHHLADPALCLSIIQWFQQTAHVRVMGGVPAGWATLSTDSFSDPTWAKVYAALDIVQPWTVGRYHSPEEADQWKESHLAVDLALTRKNRQFYLPVIFPGFSWHNLNRNSPENQIPRLGGRFLWRQAWNARSAGALSVKIAMFDEVNEGTAIFKAAPLREDAPRPGYWLTLDADGNALPNDWYLRVASSISDMIHGRAPASETLPITPPASNTAR